jgi:hypothetical protein
VHRWPLHLAQQNNELWIIALAISKTIKPHLNERMTIGSELFWTLNPLTMVRD